MSKALQNAAMGTGVESYKKGEKSFIDCENNNSQTLYDLCRQLLENIPTPVL